MPSVLNMLGLNDSGFNIVFVIPVAAVLVAVNLLFKFRVRKTQISNQSQTTKKQKSTTSKIKDVKPTREKKVKVEKKTLANVDKKEDASDDIKSKPNKTQSAVNGKSPKKNVPAKVAKKTVLNSSKNNKRPENILQSLDNKTEEGEWQTVAKKKQKQTKPVETVEVVVSKKSEKSPEKTLKNKKKSTTANENSISATFVKSNAANESSVAAAVVKPITPNENSISATVVNTEEISVEIKEVLQPQPVPQEQKSVEPLFTTYTSLSSTSTSNNIANSDRAEDSTLTSQGFPTTNVAFDELGDDAWTDTKTKPQRKNRKKALRE